MPSAESGFRWRDWLLACLLAIAFKQAFSQMEAAQLQWLLRPLAWLLGAVTDLSFQHQTGGEWLDAKNGLVIVKACAGGNFLIASWLGYLWRWRDRGFSPALGVTAFAAAWAITLTANTLRILLIAHGEDRLAAVTGISASDSHRLIGIGVYFGCLLAQLASAPARKHALAVATAIYLGITLLLPATRAFVLGLGGLDPGYIAWTAGIPVTLLLALGTWRLLGRKLQRGPGPSLVGE
jgi:exosortase K